MPETNDATTQTPPETKAAEATEDRGSALGSGTQAVETKTDDQKPAEQKPPVEEKPLTPADLKLPEGFSVDEAQFKSFTEVLANKDLTPAARAQALVDLHASALKAAAEGPSKAWDDVTNKWLGEIAADKDIGSGDPKSPFKPEVKAALSKIIDQVGGTELRQALDFTGAGNNPAIARAFFKMSKAFTEGGPVAGNPQTGKPQGPGAAALYPDLPTG